MNRCDKTKFNFAETFNNADGKTSGSAFLGIIIGLTAALSFLSAMVGYFIKLPNTLDVMSKIIALAFIACTLLGVRKIVGGKSTADLSIDNEEENIDKNKTDAK